MDLTEENKRRIDAMSYQNLLRMSRYAPPGNPWFQGATGQYLDARMRELRDKPGGNEEHVRASKAIGW